MENSQHFYENNTQTKKEKIINLSALITLGVLFLLWLLLVIFAVSVGDIRETLPSSSGNGTDTTFFNTSRILTIVNHVFLCGAYSVLMFIVMRYVPKFSYLTLGVFWIPFPVALVLIIIKPNIFTVYGTIVTFCSVVLTCNLIGTEWLKLPEKIIKESCKAILSSPAAIAFSMVYYFLNSLFLMLVILVHFYLNAVKDTNGSLPIYIIFLMILNGFVCLWAFRFIFNIGSMTLSGTYAIWFWNKRKPVNYHEVFYCFKLISRYHLGTIACTTSLLGGGKMHRTFLKYLIDKYRKKTLNKSLICFCICNIFDKVVFRLISFFALATSIIKGQNLQKSIEDCFGIYLKNPRKSLVAIKVIECVLITVVLIIALLMLVSLYGCLDFSSSNEQENQLNLIMLGVIAMGSLVFVLPVMAMLFAACNTILLCYLEDSTNNDGSNEKPYAMSKGLEKTLDYVDPPSLLHNKLFFCTKISSKVNVYSVS